MSTSAATTMTASYLRQHTPGRRVEDDAAQEIRDSADVTPVPPVVDVRSADLSRRRSYQVRYYATAIPSVLRRHRLVIPADRQTYRTEVHVSPFMQRQWRELFGVPPDARANLTYFTTSGTSLFMRMLADLGVNFRHVLHLASEMSFLRDVDQRPDSGVNQQLSGRITGVSVVGDRRVCLMVEHRLTAESGRALQQSRETFVIGGIARTVMDELRGIATPTTIDLRSIVTIRPRLAGRPDVHRTRLAVPHDAGLRYGAVSGDLNLVHTTRVAARLFGHRDAFLQGLATANHVLADIARHVPGRLDTFDVTFARPLYVGQTAALARDRNTFEVIDESDRVVAYGSYTTSM